MKYKVGDKVLIKNKYDPGKAAYDYKLYFCMGMIEMYGGTIKTIKHCLHDYCYVLEGTSYLWTDDMFEDISPDLIDEL